MPPTPEPIKPNRIEALQDGVFAIVMTILVLEIKIPEVGTMHDLRVELMKQWPMFLAYFVTFINIGIYWVGQHLQYHYIKRTDRVLLWINICFLMFLSLLPFNTALMSHYGSWQLPYILYGLNLIAIGLLSYSNWCYATYYHRLTDHTVSLELIRGVKRRILVAPAFALLAVLASFFSIVPSLILYIVIAPYYILPGRVDKNWRQLAVPHEDGE